jgi:PAS domain S-box-containing protein
MFPMSESEGVARADAGHAAGTDAASLAAQLREEGARLIAAQAVAKVGSWETDLTTMAVRWSDETFRIFELTPAAFSPTHPGFLEQVHPDDRAAVEQAFTASLDGGMPCAIEHRVSLPDGRVKYVEERWQVFRDDAGRPVRAIGTCQDVSAWKDAMLRLEQSQSLLRIAGRLAGRCPAVVRRRVRDSRRARRHRSDARAGLRVLSTGIPGGRGVDLRAVRGRRDALRIRTAHRVGERPYRLDSRGRGG